MQIQYLRQIPAKDNKDYILGHIAYNVDWLACFGLIFNILYLINLVHHW